MKRIEIDLEVHRAIERHRRAYSESENDILRRQVARRARIAARLCGLRYGRDLRILDNLREL